ncbi:hypothetical protein Hamer_G007328 [Homarus americanus]|uniref:Uncharacterized protein n=1 Tax=Homarus americanus TaxID=6706 RepID=A0A8J5JWE0_HOMAM|nr:hypothetical protein Hamer_G007328 [Homarus americanus]
MTSAVTASATQAATTITTRLMLDLPLPPWAEAGGSKGACVQPAPEIGRNHSQQPASTGRERLAGGSGAYWDRHCA